MTRQETIQKSKKSLLALVRRYLKLKSPSGYSLKAHEDGVMYVSDGIGEQHERWYIVVTTEPKSAAENRAREIEEILSDIERQITKKHRTTVFLMSALPVI